VNNDSHVLVRKTKSLKHFSENFPQFLKKDHHHGRREKGCRWKFVRLHLAWYKFPSYPRDERQGPNLIRALLKSDVLGKEPQKLGLKIFALDEDDELVTSDKDVDFSPSLTILAKIMFFSIVNIRVGMLERDDVEWMESKWCVCGTNGANGWCKCGANDIPFSQWCKWWT